MGTDPCAPLPKGARAETGDGTGDGDTANMVISAELVNVGSSDVGPTLVVVVSGRPLLIYRSFVSGASGDSFPFHFCLVEHVFLGIVESAPSGPYHPVATFCHPGGNPSGAVVAPPHS